MRPPILLHIPHSSTLIPERWRAIFDLGDAEMEHEVRVMTDSYTEDLFELEGAERLVFPVSRLLVDVERFHNDRDEPMAEKGMGAVYTKTHDGRPLKTLEHRGELMTEFYVPHHDALEHWATEALESHGTCLILDCHSFPSRPLPCDMSQSPDRPDVCIGTSRLHSQAGLVAAAKYALERQGWSVKIDSPYFGTIVPLPFFGREPRLASLMIEVNRKLYMDEGTGERLPSYAAVKAALGDALKTIASYWSESGNS